MRIITIVGARPQFIKAAAMSRALRRHHEEILVHTGQHYDDNMSNVFFKELGIPEPDVNLDVGSGLHGWQTALILKRAERVLVEKKPDLVIVYGDTNSTLAGALAASKIHIPVVHVEAGLRSFNRSMPEEINRVVTDHLSDILFCPSQTSVDNLKSEGVTQGVHLVGDVMADALAHFKDRARSHSTILKDLRLDGKSYILATLHRQENTDNKARLQSIMDAMSRLDEMIVFPVHPRTGHAFKQINYAPPSHINFISPVGYLDMIMLEQSAKMILTDSGGVQKEAYWLKVPCITLRDETEWIETVDAGWNRIAGADREKIFHLAMSFRPPDAHPPLYGYGEAVSNCLDVLNRRFEFRNHSLSENAICPPAE